jgi:hypothetical protein
LNIALAVVLEAAEPDELLPTGLPVDDVARKALHRGMREALEEGGLPALGRLLRRELGDDLAEQVLHHVDFDDWVEGVDHITTPLSREAKKRLRAQARDIWERVSGRRTIMHIDTQHLQRRE